MEPRKNPLSDMLSELIPDAGTHIGKFLTDEELTEFATFTKDNANTFFSGALQQRAREKLIKYAFHNRQDKIQAIFTRYPGLKNDKPLMLNLFLHHISFGQPKEAIEILNEHPEFVTEYGTVITHSGDIIEHLTGVQLAYVLEDEDMGKKIWDCVDTKLDRYSKEIASQQLASKVAEVQAQEWQFVNRDYTALVKKIANDDTLKRTGKPSPETQQAADELMADFKARVVTKGRPFNMRHLEKAYEVYKENWGPWFLNQLCWYFDNVIDPLQNRVSTCYGQAFSQGIDNLLDKDKLLELNRSLKIATNYINQDDLYYFNGLDSPLGYELSLMSHIIQELDTTKLNEKPYLIKDHEEKYYMWGYKVNKWKLTEIDDLKIPLEWKENQTVNINPQDKIFDTLKKGHIRPALIKGKDFFVDIKYGVAVAGPLPDCAGCRDVKNLCGAKATGLEEFKQRVLQQPQDTHALEQRSYRR